MTVTERDIQVFNDSLEACGTPTIFLSRFYERFLNSSPQVKGKFADVDMVRQRRMLANAFYLFASDSRRREASPELERVAEVHSRRGHDVDPSLYDLFLECLVETARDFDPQFDASREHAWRAVMGHAIAFMQSRY